LFNPEKDSKLQTRYSMETSKWPKRALIRTCYKKKTRNVNSEHKGILEPERNLTVSEIRVHNNGLIGDYGVQASILAREP